MEQKVFHQWSRGVLLVYTNANPSDSTNNKKESSHDPVGF